ncbi:MAG: hypothetical protein N0E44_17990 [Candidatus Thiodiazotropha lotti]|nr:hypothetical protein [Candidatus Thiodiazotropha lotti]MCW4221775.1 hypothetical protein [Candidatus Thiodiazotropha lotti]
MKKRELAAEAFVDNLNALIKYIEMESGKEPSNREISKGHDVSDRMIGKIRNRDSIPTIDKADEIAQYFKLPAWVLLLPGHPNPSQLLSGDIEQLLSDYIKSDALGRQQILATAKHESRRATHLAGLPETYDGGKAKDPTNHKDQGPKTFSQKKKPTKKK